MWTFPVVLNKQYAYTLYVVLKNYYYPTSLSDLQDSMSRAIDRGATAFKVADLMDKHGNSDWLEPLIDKVSTQWLLLHTCAHCLCSSGLGFRSK